MVDKAVTVEVYMESVGSTEFVSVGNYTDIPAKIDTGADASVIWASGIRVSEDGVLRFVLFDKSSPYYTGKVFKRTDFGAARVKSSNGIVQIRYRTHLVVTVAGRQIRALFYLTNRSTQQFPVLIGRRTISGKFVVDVSKSPIPLRKPARGFDRRLRRDPYRFHQEYIDRVSANS